MNFKQVSLDCDQFARLRNCFRERLVGFHIGDKKPAWWRTLRISVSVQFGLGVSGLLHKAIGE